jgi:hypothetical protein
MVSAEIKDSDFYITRPFRATTLSYNSELM